MASRKQATLLIVVTCFVFTALNFQTGYHAFSRVSNPPIKSKDVAEYRNVAILERTKVLTSSQHVTGNRYETLVTSPSQLRKLGNGIYVTIAVAAGVDEEELNEGHNQISDVSRTRLKPENRFSRKFQDFSINMQNQLLSIENIRTEDTAGKSESTWDSISKKNSNFSSERNSKSNESPNNGTDLLNVHQKDVQEQNAIATTGTISSTFLSAKNRRQNDKQNALNGHNLFDYLFKVLQDGFDESFFTVLPESIGPPEKEEPQSTMANLNTAIMQQTEVEAENTRNQNGGNESGVAVTEGPDALDCDCNRDSYRGDPRDTPGRQIILRRVSEGKVLQRPVPFVSTCSKHATARGPHQKVVSYSYFGNTQQEGLFDRYFSQIPHRALEVLQLYPGWVMRVYHNVSRQEDPRGHSLLCNAFCTHHHLDLCDVRHLPQPWHRFTDIQRVGTLWRFLTMVDPLVDVTISRDLDSYILPREVEAVGEWLTSSQPYHAMRDHPLHNTFMLAGLWGGRPELDRANMYHLVAVLLSQSYNEVWDYDQKLLRRILWPAVKNKTMVHDSYFCRVLRAKGDPQPRPFPTRREGQNYTGFGESKIGSAKMLTPCPVSCRPPDHQDWKYC